MPTEKIAEWPFCTDDDHSPKKENLSPGTYRHKCRKCGHTEEFTVFPGQLRRKDAEPWPIFPSPLPIPMPIYPPFPNPHHPTPWRHEIICMVGR